MISIVCAGFFFIVISMFDSVVVLVFVHYFTHTGRFIKELDSLLY